MMRGENVFQSTLPTRGSDFLPPMQKGSLGISIHAPHEGERRLEQGNGLLCAYFNPRSPRGGATWTILDLKPRRLFQSTLPTRGSDYMHIFGGVSRHTISIHAPHEGERPCCFRFSCQNSWNFNPRSPRGGATRYYVFNTFRQRNFNPRSPRGGATVCCVVPMTASKFQSTLPTRGSDNTIAYFILKSTYFNPRSPRGGATRYYVFNTFRQRNFNPRSPRGGATRAIFFKKLNKCRFQSTLPTRGSDLIG